MESNVAVVLNVRNEEKHIEKTIQSILDQKLLPYRIIVINDGSTDNTKQILSNFSTIELIDKPVRNENYLARKELADTINQGLKKLHARLFLVFFVTNPSRSPPNTHFPSRNDSHAAANRSTTCSDSRETQLK